jgi:hypothetical protein
MFSSGHEQFANSANLYMSQEGKKRKKRIGVLNTLIARDATSILVAK